MKPNIVLLSDCSFDGTPGHPLKTLIVTQTPLLQLISVCTAHCCARNMLDVLEVAVSPALCLAEQPSQSRDFSMVTFESNCRPASLLPWRNLQVGEGSAEIKRGEYSSFSIARESAQTLRGCCLFPHPPCQPGCSQELHVSVHPPNNCPCRHPLYTLGHKHIVTGFLPSRTQ